MFAAYQNAKVIKAELRNKRRLGKISLRVLDRQLIHVKAPNP